MQLWRLWVLKGPNIWAACPVLEAGVDLKEWADESRPQTVRAIQRILTWLPAVGLDLDGDSRVAGMAHVLERVALHLQVLAGNPVSFAQTRRTSHRHRYRVAVEHQEEPVGRACLQTAVEICRAAWEGRAFAVEAELSRLRTLADDQRLGPSTHAVVEAARARGIPVAHLNPEDGRYLQLGYGAQQRRSLATETEDISAVARSITTDKHLTKQLLREAGVPVPWGRPARDAEDAWAAACEIGLPVAVKPQDRDLAQGVGLNLRTRDQVMAAYQAAREKSFYVMVERFAPGTEHRVLVIDDRVIAVAHIEPPHVVGDGVSRVTELVEAVNRDPRRGDAYPSPLRRIKLDAVALDVLAAQDFTPDSVPARGERVLLRRNPPHIENGGYLRDVTERVHPEVAACAVAAVRALRIRVAGVDVVAEDISRPLESQGGVIVEINTGPGMGLHTAPWSENPRPVGEAIVASLFPPGNDGRIPIFAVTGGRARAAGRCLAALLTERGFRVGRVYRNGICVAGRKIALEGTTTSEKTRALLRSTLIDVAILELSARDLLREGVGCDRCDVALVTGSLEPCDRDAPACADADASADELAEASVAVLRALGTNGRAVLNADTPSLLAAALPSADRVIWFSQSDEHPCLIDHRAAGGTAVFLSDDSLVLARGSEEQRLAFGGHPIEKEPGEQLGLLAAMAGATVLNLCGDEGPAAVAPPPPIRKIEPSLSAV
ncbi:MAG TPA: acetate--CoA ligase family protein [Gemmataceae bacterium]